MLHDTGNATTADCLDRPTVAADRVPERKRAVPPPVAETTASNSGGRYGDSRGFNYSALGVTVLIHLVLGLGLLGLGAQAAHKKAAAHLVTMDLSAPPPAPATPPEKATTQKLAVAVQQPVVQTPIPQQPMMALTPPAPAPAPPAAVRPAADASPPQPPAPPAPASPVTASNLSTRMISGSPPRYPLESRSKREQGTVKLLIILSVDGSVETISISQSSGFPRLDNAALSAVRRWRWAPTLRDGTPLKVRGVVEIPFVLQGAK